MKSQLLARTFVWITFFMFSFSLSAQEQTTSVSNDTEPVNTAKTANIKCITPPLGFDTLAGLNGYYHRAVGASIVISTVEGKTTADAEEAFNEEHIKNIQSKLISKSHMTLNDGNDMLLFKLTYEFNGETWGRYQAFVSDESTTVWVVVSYPVKYSDDVEGVLLKSLRSLKFDQR